MTSKTLPLNTHDTRWERHAGVTPQFERTDGDYLFRRDGCGPAIRVSIGERDAFAAAGRKALFWHVAVWALCGWAGWLMVDRIMADGDQIVAAIGLGIVQALIAMVLYGSMRWHADAPGRALTGRPIERPARDPDFTGRLDYGAIMVLTVFLLVMAAFGSRQPASFYISFASASVMLGLFMTLRRWHFNRGLTPQQRARASAAAREQRERKRGERRSGAPDYHPLMAIAMLFVVVFFVIAETAAVVGGFSVGSNLVIDIAGKTFDSADGVTMLGAGLLGSGLAVLFGWMVDSLCQRLTDVSPFAFVGEFPVGW